MVGEIDVATAAILRTAATASSSIGEQNGLVLDLSDVTFIDSSGLSALLAIAHSRTEQSPLVVLDPSSVAARALALIGFEQHPAVRVAHRHAQNG